MILLQRKLSYGGKATLNFNKNQINNLIREKIDIQFT